MYINDRKCFSVTATFLLSAVIIAVALVAIAFVWSSYNRYHIVALSDGTGYELDRSTGGIWFLNDTSKILLKTNNILQLIPSTIAKNINGISFVGGVTFPGNYGPGGEYSGYVSNDYFYGKIYNASEITISRLVIEIRVYKNKYSDEIIWENSFGVPQIIKPLSTAMIKVPFSVDDPEKVTWRLKEAYVNKQ